MTDTSDTLGDVDAIQPIAPLATVRSYSDLLTALRDRAEQLNISRASIGDCAGFHQGYAETILSGVKSLGPQSLAPFLTAMGLKLILVEDVEAVAKYASRIERRQCVPRMPPDAVLTKRRRRRRAKAANQHCGDSSWGKRMAAMRQLRLSKFKRTAIARIAARVRWRGK